MATSRDTFESVIYVNKEQADDAMSSLTSKLEKLNKEYENLASAEEQDAKAMQKVQRQIDQTQRSIDGITQGTENYAKAMRSLDTRSIDSLIKLKKQLNAEIRKLKPGTEEYIKLTKDYKQVAERLKSVEEGYKGVTKEQNKSTDGLSKLKAGFTKYAGWISAITTAFKGVIKVTKEVVQASQTMGDKWNNGISAMKTTTEAFFMALSTNNFDAFNEGISGALKNAKKLAEAMDLIGSYNISEGVMQSEYLTDYNEQRTIAMDTERTKEEREAALNKMEEDIKHYNDFVQSKGEETLATLQDQFEAWKGITFDSEEEFRSFFVRLFEKTNIGKDEPVENLKRLYEGVEGAQKYLSETRKSANLLLIGNAKELVKSTQESFDAAYNSADKETQKLFKAWELNDKKLKDSAELFTSYRNSVRAVAQYELQTNKTRERVNKQLAKAEEDKIKAEEEAAKKRKKASEEAQKELEKEMAANRKAQQELNKIIPTLTPLGPEGSQKSESQAPSGSTSTNRDLEAMLENLHEVRMTIEKENWQEEYEFEMWKLDQLHDQGLLKEEDYQKAKLQVVMKYAKKSATDTNNIANQLSTMSSAIQEAETATLEAEYQKRLSAAGDNAEEREAIEAEYEQKKLDIQKKYADVDMAINIAKAIAAGALAIAEAFAAAGGNPVVGGIFAAIIGVTTAAQIATIIAQRNAIKAASAGGGGGGAKTGNRTVTGGYAEGGYTEDHTTVTTVGERGREWVAPHWQVAENPVLFANLERDRKYGRSRSGSIAKGFADGGFTSGSEAVSQPDSVGLLASVLANIQQNGIQAYMVYDQFQDFQSTRNKFKNKTSR